MADLYVLNGTNAVGMNGTNAVGMNGTNAVGLNGYSTGDVMPLNGTNAVLLNGTNAVTLNADELADLSPYDVDVEGLNGTAEDLDAYRLAVIYGDEAALQGYSIFNGARKDRVAARRAERSAAKAEKKARRKQRFEARQERLKSGGTFFQQIGSGLKEIAPALKERIAGAAASAEDALLDEGIEPNEDVLLAKMLKQGETGNLPADETTQGGGLMAKFNALSTPAKIGIVAGGAALLYFGYKAITGKKGKKR